MTKQEIVDSKYFDWLYDICTHDLFAKTISYRDLLSCLHSIEFIPIMNKDENRAIDGINLRHKFEKVSFIYDAALYLNKPCSVLEMMVALAIRCETTIMSNTAYGDRTQTWFWEMVRSLGLRGQWNDGFDEQLVRRKIDIFVHREYNPDGSGGLFTVKNATIDMRDVEIWTQMNWYLNSIIDFDL